jgi:dTDP-4-amino-4,6-dideoxy-D-glucose acyltransferase
MTLDSSRNSGIYEPDEAALLGLRSLGTNVRIHRTALIFEPQHVDIGDNSRIDAFTIITGSEIGVSIGRHVHVASGAYLFGGGGISIHDFAGISCRAIILSSNDDYSGNFLTGPTIPEQFTNVLRSRITIGRHVVIGAASIVMPGVEIGVGAAVGAQSLVKANVDPFTIVAGNPMRVLRKREQGLLELEKFLSVADEGTAS